MAETITFSFTPNKCDYIRSMRAFSFRQRTTKLFILIFLLASLFSLVSTFWLDTSVYYLCLFFPMLVIFFLLFLFFMHPISTGDKVEKNERLRSETVWQVDENQVLIKTKFAETKLDWGTFGEALETSEHFLLTYGVNKNMFQIVPKRAFPSAVQQDEFWKFLEKKIGSVSPTMSIPLPEPSWKVTRVFVYGFLAVLILFTIYINFQ